MMFALVLGASVLGISAPAYGDEGDDARTLQLRRECREGRGNVDVCAELAGRLRDGNGAARDELAALALFERGCQRGRFVSCRLAGAILESPTQFPQDMARAHPFLVRACENDDFLACGRAGDGYDAGWSGPQDRVRALEMFRRGCDGASVANVCRIAGNYYLNGWGTERNGELAVRYLDRACMLREHRACFTVGGMYAEGALVAQDYDRAIMYQRPACENNEANSCASLAYLYANGRGVARSMERAVRYADQSCRAGLQMGCNSLEALRGHVQANPDAAASAALVEIDRRVIAEAAIPRSLPHGQRFLLATSALRDDNFAVAVPVIQDLAQALFPDAVYTLGVMHYSGRGVTRNAEEAGRLLQRAADLQHPYALYYLAHMNWNADGVRWNPIWAIALMNRAAELGVPGAGLQAQQWTAERNAYFDQRQAELEAQERARVQQQWRGTALESAWNNYFAQQAQQAGDRVCGLIYSNGRTVQDCMSRDTYDRYYNPQR